MKKIIVLLLFLMMSILLVLPTTYAYVPPISNTHLINQGLGRTIDVATSKYAHPDSIILGSNVINPTYLSNLSLDRIEYSGDFTHDYQSGTSMSSYYLQKKLAYEQATSLSGTYKLFTGTISDSFQAAIASSEYERVGQYYSTTSLTTKTVKAALPNYLDNIAQYRNNLNSTFVNNCYKLNNGLMTYSQFVQMYGTHLVASAVFGGKVNLSYSVSDSTKYFSSSIGTDIQEKIDLGIVGFSVPSLSFQTQVSLSNIRAVTSSNATLRFHANSIGGSGFGDKTSQGNFTTDLQTWANGVHSNPAIIDYSPNGLVPLWELVPVSYTYAKAILQNNLNSYITSVNDNLPYLHSISVDQLIVRSSEKTITDNGRFTNPYDNVNLSNSGYTFNDLLLRNITTVNVVISLDAKEVDDGYQHIFLYDGSLQTSNLLGSYEFEHGSGYKNTQYNDVDKPYVFIFTIPLAELTSSFTIRYGASGNYADTWKNKNIRISYMFF